MRYYVNAKSGQTVATLTTGELHKMLAWPYLIASSPSATAENILEQARIELLARSMKL